MNHAMPRKITFLLALIVALGLPLVLRSGSLASEVLIYALAALGCNLLLGYTGLLSFGQGIFFGLGSYTIAILLTRLQLPMPLALLAAIAMGALGAAVVGWVAIRQRGKCIDQHLARERTRAQHQGQAQRDDQRQEESDFFGHGDVHPLRPSRPCGRSSSTAPIAT